MSECAASQVSARAPGMSRLSLARSSSRLRHSAAAASSGAPPFEVDCHSQTRFRRRCSARWAARSDVKVKFSLVLYLVVRHR